MRIIKKCPNFLKCPLCHGSIEPNELFEFRSGRQSNFRCLPCAMKHPARWYHNLRGPSMSYEHAFEMYELDRDLFVPPSVAGKGGRGKGGRI